jgi:Tfp pilus assembly protein PilO
MEELYKRLAEVPAKRRPLIAVAVALVTMLGWYALGVYPIKGQIIAEQDNILRIRKKLEQRPKTIAHIKDLDRDIDSQRDRKRSLGERLPSEDDIADLLKKIHDRARDSGLRLSRFERGSSVTEELYVRIEVKMEFDGSFKQILSFINELGDVRGLDRIINVERLNLMRIQKNEGVFLRGSFLLVTFKSKPAVASAATPQGGAR